jgi:hypothetical protein
LAGENVIELLVKSGLLDDRQHDTVHSRAKSNNGGQLVQMVAELGYATESTIARALSVELGLPRIDLHVTPPEPDATLLLEFKFCSERYVLPVALREGGELLWLAMGDPTDSTTMALVRRQTGKRVRPVVAGPTEIIREARRIYAAAVEAEEQQFEHDPASIELNEGAGGDEQFEVVNIADESASPEVIAAAFSSQPGTLVDSGGSSAGKPKTIPPGSIVDPQATVTPAYRAPPASIRATAPPPSVRATAPPPSLRTAPPTRPPPPPSDDLNLSAYLTPPKTSPGIARNDLAPEDLLSLEAVRASMEKAALVLRALAELCVDKGLFTREEMRNKSK